MSISKTETDIANKQDYISRRSQKLIENTNSEITKEMEEELFNLRNWYFDDHKKRKKKK